MSQLGSSPVDASGRPVAVRRSSAVARQPFNIYTVMLIIAFVSLLIGSIVLFIEINKYGRFPAAFPWRTDEAVIRTGWQPPVLSGSGLEWRTLGGG